MLNSNISKMLIEAAHEGGQDSQIKLHRKHIQAIWRHLEKLEQAIEIDAGDAVTIAVGDASITLKKNGNILIKGGEITIQGSRRINVKASSDVTIKGSNIRDN